MEHGEEKAPPQRHGGAAVSMIDVDVGPYRIIEKLGEGGMGVVYKAMDRSLQREVALKILFEVDDEQNVKRFQQEARALAKLAHPNAIHIFWIGEYKGMPCFAMEYISEGVSVYDLLRDKGVLPLEASVDIIVQSAKGLSAARRAGIVHRDIKPNNLLIDSDGTVKISDFGLAKIMEGDGHLTQSGIVMGTPYYMSPEQGQGEAIDHRSDLYSLGATFYHMITGFTPYEAQNPVSLIIKHVKEPIPDIRTVNPSIPDSIRRIVETCLQKDPADRYQEYEDLIEDLEAFQAGEAPAHAEAARPRRGAAGKMPSWVYFVSGIALAGIFGGSVWYVSTEGGLPVVEPTQTAPKTVALVPTPKTVPTADALPVPTPEPGEIERARAEMAVSDPERRARAAVTFGKLGSEEAIPDLVKAATDSDPVVRARAVWALGRTRSPKGTSAIVKALADGDPTVVAVAIDALDGRLDVSMVEPMKALAAKHADPAIRRAASIAVDKVFLEDPDKVFAGKPGLWWKDEFRGGAGSMSNARQRAVDAERTVRYYRQKYGFVPGEKTPPAGSEPDAKRAFSSVYTAAVRALAAAEAELKTAESRQKDLIAAADAAQVPPEWRR